MAAFLLVPAAQAFAENTLTVNLAGSGSGEVSSVGGGGPYGGGEGEFEGEPPIECSGPPAVGTCVDEMVNNGGSEEEAVANEFGLLAVNLHVTAGPGSEFAGWTVEEGNPFGSINGCEGLETHCWMYVSIGEDAKVTATFECIEEGGCEEETGPTNRRLLTVTKSANGPGGTGSVSSKPKGIKCGTACSKAEASMYKETPVTLTEKPGTTSTFVEWTGACTGSGPTCTVPIAEDEEVGAVFTGTSKVIANPQELTLSKGESSGFGTVKGAGIACEAECTQTVVLYQGPNIEKAKPGKTVILTQVAAPGSEFIEWGGACSGAGACEVTMEEAEEVTATFDLLPAQTLTLTKSANGPGGTGSVSSKPKGIKCGTACESAEATFWEGAEVTLTEKPGTTSTFVEWTGGDCEGLTTPTCVVTLNVAEEVEAVFTGTSKVIANPQELTLTKAGSGLGSVKAAGLACEVLCAQTTVLYAGPNIEKAKPGKTVILIATSAPGSKAVVWSGCTPISASECEVTMEEAENVTATFDELE